MFSEVLQTWKTTSREGRGTTNRSIWEINLNRANGSHRLQTHLNVDSSPRKTANFMQSSGFGSTCSEHCLLWQECRNVYLYVTVRTVAFIWNPSSYLKNVKWRRMKNHNLLPPFFPLDSKSRIPLIMPTQRLTSVWRKDITSLFKDSNIPSKLSKTLETVSVHYLQSSES